MVLVNSAIDNLNQIDIYPGNEESFEGDLRIINQSMYIIKIAYDAIEGQVHYTYFNGGGVGKSSNIFLGRNIGTIEVLNGEDGKISFNYLLRNRA